MIINSGNTLEITGGVLIFEQGAQLIVREDATLDCSGNVRLGSCENWQGIRVNSDSSTPLPAGSLKLDGCVIENAIVGIQSHDDNSDAGDISGLSTWEAGEITANWVTFVNNNKSVELFVGDNSTEDENEEVQPNVSFTNCTFDVNDEFEAHHPFQPFIQHLVYWKIRGYSFESCTFKNSSTDASFWGQMGVGILSFNALYDVNECIFNRLNTGIDAMVLNAPFNGMDILESTFSQNRIGIHQNGICWQTIAHNEITVGDEIDIDFLDEVSEQEREGIVLVSCGVFEVQENTITDAQDANVLAETYGIRVRDMIGEEAVIRSNILIDLDYGNAANGDNSGDGDVPVGLRYLCNINMNNVYDIYAAEFGNADPEAYLAQHQGIVVALNVYGDAGNVFSASQLGHPNPDVQNFNHTGENIPSLLSYYSDDYSTSELMFSGNIDENTVGIAPNGCQQEIFMVPGIWSDWEVGLSDYVTIADEAEDVGSNLEYIYQAIIDDGKTDELQDEVDFAWTDEVWEMRDKLLDLSPNVSLKVLYQLADKTEVFPHPIAMEIFVANPDVLRDFKFLKYLETKTNPLPSYMLDLLYSARDQITFRKLLLDQMAAAKTAELHAKNRMMHMYASHGFNAEAGAIFGGFDNADRDMLMAEMALDMGDLVAAGNYLSELKERGNPRDPSILNEIARFEEWFAILLDVNQSLNGKWESLNSSQLHALGDLAKHYSTFGGKRAMGILNFFYGANLFINPAHGNGEFNWKFGTTEENLLGQDDSFKIYPNPADVLINVELNYSTPLDKPDAIAIYNELGQLHEVLSVRGGLDFQSVDVRDWPSGMYTFVLMAKNKSLNNAKIIIEH